VGFVKVGAAENEKCKPAVEAEKPMLFPSLYQREEKKQRDRDPEETFNNIAVTGNAHKSKTSLTTLTANQKKFSAQKQRVLDSDSYYSESRRIDWITTASTGTSS